MSVSINLLRSAVIAVGFAFVFPLAGAGVSHASCSPSQGNKYSKLLKRIHVPGDARRWGRCKDYGYWSGRRYKGVSLPAAGHWVYAYPYWYVWAYVGRYNPRAGHIGCSASQGGKYAGLMKKIYKPDSYRKYRGCHDYGWWVGKSYAGRRITTRGYWVFKHPYWYVWRRKVR